MLSLSAQTPEALQDLARRYQAFFREHDNVTLADVCHTASIGRAHHEHRAASVVRSVAEAREMLAAIVEDSPHRALLRGRVEPSLVAPRVALVFSGAGDQIAAAGRALYTAHPLLRATETPVTRAFVNRLVGHTFTPYDLMIQPRARYGFITSSAVPEPEDPVVPDIE